MNARIFLIAGLGALALTLAGCGRKDREKDTDRMDRELMGAAADDIRVDPALTQKNAKAPLKAPPPTVGESRGKVTLGELARIQAGTAGAGCNRNVDYGLDWAKRLPPSIPLIPGARLIEAAGSNEARCRLRVVSFTSAQPMQAVIDWYYTQAIRAGYSSEHQLADGDHILAGTRDKDDGAYYIFFADRKGGGTDVDLIANNGL